MGSDLGRWRRSGYVAVPGRDDSTAAKERMMLVVQATRFGGPDVLVAHQVPGPMVGAGEVLVQVAAIDTMVIETRIRAGQARDWFPVTPPYVPGGALTGTVAAVGADVDPGLRGRRVAAYVAGSYAEQVVAPAAELIDVPDALDLRESAALSYDGPTALALAELAGLKPDQRVVVVGGTGGAAILLVQLARAAGAHVLATARGQVKLDLVRRLGADEAVDTGAADWPSLRADVVFDGVGGAVGTAAVAAVAAGGTFLGYGAATAGGFATVDGSRELTSYGIGDLRFGPARQRELLARAFAAAVEGSIVPVIGQTFPLAHAGQAHTAIERRAVTGKTLLLP
ncbi:zinc-binding dehydrogenase [Actinocatenispora comari]|uniref:NADPH:quinone reductase n=1 Tax=Actinocatenispora comari TaxID=2807577 RepID=A0A8J4AFC2_9ACTN|nr:zinc-binding dehydrogenase [Actinocatenispora comari]GIL29610.1 NADPH:quinone reductase [Actinocatenispora comari]